MPSQPYTADGVVVCCFDARIRPARDEFLRRYGVERPDLVSIAGGALALSCPRTDFDQAFVLEQIQLAIRLHGAKRLVMMSHSDCGTYGGLAAFGGSQEREIEHHVTQLRGASKIAAGQFPGLLIERIFLRFDSVLSVGGHECAEHFQGS